MTKYKITIIILSVFSALFLGLVVFLFIKYGDVIKKTSDYEKIIEERKDIEAALINDKLTMSEEFASLSNEYASLEDEKNKLSDEKAGLEDEKASLSDENSKLSEELEKATEEIESALAEAESISSEYDSLTEDYAKLNDEYYGIKANGRLKVIGTQLCNESGQPVQLCGMSTHGISWYPRYTNTSALQTLKGYGANVIRLAVYSEQNDSYRYEKEENLNYLYSGIENALSQNMYVIVDWHVLQDENPAKYKEDAKVFFQEITSHYGDNPGIIYEICNEPNGSTTWNDIVNYANEIIPLIRQNAPNAIIIVGTPDFSFDVQEVLDNPLKFENIMYTFHNYVDVTYTDTSDMNWMEKKLKLDIPIFVTEWGITDNKTGSTMYEERALKFVEFMERNNISWCMWSISNKDEVYSFLKPSCNKYSNWTEEDLTFSGKIAIKSFEICAE